MFGFLNPRPHTNSYRRAYARLCLYQRQNFGMAALAFHSYEAVFLYQLACDAGAVPAKCLPNIRCCKLSRKEDVTKADDGQIGRFCSSVAMLLASIKLNDDVADSRSWFARGVRFVLKRRFTRARMNLTKFDPHAATMIGGFLQQHAALEKQSGPLQLGDYVTPTANAFGYVFGLAGTLPGLAKYQGVLRDVGQHVGAALIAFDCAVDFAKDRRRGEFNPLQDAEAVTAALHFSAEQLQAAAELCRRYFGHQSQAAATLVRVADRVLQRAGVGDVCPAVRSPWQQLWLFARRAVTGSPLMQMAFAGAVASSEGIGGEPPIGGGAGVPPVGPPGGGARGTRRDTGASTDSSGSSGSCGDCVYCGDCPGVDCNACDGVDCSGCDCGGCDFGGC